MNLTWCWAVAGDTVTGPDGKAWHLEEVLQLPGGTLRYVRVERAGVVIEGEFDGGTPYPLIERGPDGRVVDQVRGELGGFMVDVVKSAGRP